jgi:hypothetical protein
MLTFNRSYFFLPLFIDLIFIPVENYFNTSELYIQLKLVRKNTESVMIACLSKATYTFILE